MPSRKSTCNPENLTLSVMAEEIIFNAVVIFVPLSILFWLERRNKKK